MEPINPVTAQRVWQRVRGNEGDSPDVPARLLALETEIQHILHVLQKNPLLRENRQLSHLREDSRKLRQIFSGFCRLSGGDGTAPVPPSIRGNPEGLIRQCIKARRQSLSLLDSLPQEHEDLKAPLRRQAEASFLSLLAMLGQLPNP